MDQIIENKIESCDNPINERNWDLLLDAIERKRVVPIIGNEFFYVKSSNENIPIETFILDMLSERFVIEKAKVDFTYISDYIEEENYRSRRNRFIGSQTDIYFEIDNILRNINVICKKEILDFLAINKFPLILTTSFVCGLENNLNTIFSDLNVKVYDKSSRVDISTSINSNVPTLYYLFGRANRIKKSYMVTEDDLLDYLHLWHNVETRPIYISEYLKDKFLLVLGCGFPNWLFRFFWHSIRNFSLFSSSFDLQGIVTLENLESDRELTKFLSRIQTQTYDNSNNFIQVFLSKWNSRCLQNKVQNSNEDDDVDIFISYAKEDFEVVNNISENLKRLGAKVWLDKNELEWSNLYESIIQEKITKSKRFVPILSKSTLMPGRRFFRREWAMAIRENDYRYGLPYFAPISIDDIDINADIIPKPFRDTHIINISDVDIDNELKRLIRSFR